jgi:2-polyprenyl-3-methyl-5-hydroxy-6-metoxy-1,4-benzoquinol methylase
MLKRIEHREEAIAGAEEARKYVEEHERHARFQFGAMLKGIKALGISGDYLEIGAGPGILAAMIAEDNHQIRIATVDLSPDMVAIAEEYVKERKLQDRISCLLADAGDEKTMKALGKFDLVYSAFSLHHWSRPEKIIGNLWNAVRDNGMLYLYDFKRVWWLYYLPLKSGDLKAIRASYTPGEIKAILQRAGISKYKIKTPLPFFWQSVIVWK